MSQPRSISPQGGSSTCTRGRLPTSPAARTASGSPDNPPVPEQPRGNRCGDAEHDVPDHALAPVRECELEGQPVRRSKDAPPVVGSRRVLGSQSWSSFTAGLRDKRERVGPTHPQDGSGAMARELHALGWPVRGPAPSCPPSAEGKAGASTCKPARRARAVQTGGTHAAGTSRSRHRSIASRARLLPAAVAEREQAERQEQQWQEEDMASTRHEHDHGNCKADCKHTHQRTPSNSAFPGLARKPAPGERRPACADRPYFASPSRTSPRQAPVSSSRLSISCLNRSRSP